MFYDAVGVSPFDNVRWPMGGCFLAAVSGAALVHLPSFDGKLFTRLDAGTAADAARRVEQKCFLHLVITNRFLLVFMIPQMRPPNYGHGNI